ncbi:MAG: DeoR/GlpR transcriptional regulator [Gammaproteobacteria bacterium]|nr:DeoR/GlpR transcriptional regulator [Gammaproteobacteria bacterium]
MLEKQRQQIILDILAERHFASVTNLAEELSTSESTIRRDINKLDKSGQLKKIHGGAENLHGTKGTPLRTHAKGSSFLVNLEKNIAGKRAIAKRAVDMCEDGETIIINGGSTTFMMSEFLVGRHLSILTNSLPLAAELNENTENQVILPGGYVFRKQGVIASPFDIDTVGNYHATKIFLGTPGVSKFGIMESDPVLIRSEQQLRRQAEKLIVLADQSKLGVNNHFVGTPLNEVDLLITDADASHEMVKFLKGKDIQIELVNSD